MSRAARSMFVQKLHKLLEDNADPDNLYWVDEEAFDITVDDTRARRALSPNFDFNSISSFIRQLSYYGFTRLSDRRKSAQRRSGSGATHIRFKHSTGYFVRGDSSKLSSILRKPRVRPVRDPVTGRKNSSTSSSQRSPSASDQSDEYADDQNLPPVFVSHDPFAAGRAASSWAPPPAGVPSGIRRKPSLQLNLANSLFNSYQSGGQGSWDMHSSPYPTPLAASSSSFASTSYGAATSGASYPPLHSPNVYSHPEPRHVQHQRMYDPTPSFYRNAPAASLPSPSYSSNSEEADRDSTYLPVPQQTKMNFFGADSIAPLKIESQGSSSYSQHDNAASFDGHGYRFVEFDGSYIH